LADQPVEERGLILGLEASACVAGVAEVGAGIEAGGLRHRVAVQDIDEIELVSLEEVGDACGRDPEPRPEALCIDPPVGVDDPAVPGPPWNERRRRKPFGANLRIDQPRWLESA